MNWLSYFFGLDNGSGAHYLFWSGIGSDATEFLILGGIIQLYRRHNCHVKGCWRMQRRAVAGTGHIVCNKHHPVPLPSHEDVKRDHVTAKRPAPRARASR
jgi:hypothetical protein